MMQQKMQNQIWSILFFLFGIVHVVSAAPLVQKLPLAAKPLPLSAVRLTDGPLKKAQDVDAQYLLSLEPDRMMAYFRIRAGLPPKAKGYGGWDGEGKNLTGHIAGHYLSAVSLMYAATGDKRFKERADYLVREMKEVQDKNGDGYLGALEGDREKFAEVARGEIRSGGFDLNGLWAPWYVLHKIYAGLRDSYRYTGNKDALEIETKFAVWAEGILSKLDEAQTQKMLNTEFGGMNEVLADLYADTGDERWLKLSHRFEHHAVLDPLKKGEDKLAGLHGNTQVPKLVGSLARHIYTGDKADGDAAKFFWERVVNHHSFATGGHGKDEYFGPPDKLNDRIDGRTAESCNVYNMLKITRGLFALQPDVRYAEFQERALFNHVLASLDPETGRSCYMVPVGRGVQHEYQDMLHHFTCCVGTGMESHALHGDGIYYEAPGKLWVNLCAPSTADWQAQNAKLVMESDFPEGQNASLKIELATPEKFTLLLRRPSWAGAGFAVSLNGKVLKTAAPPGSYIEVNRWWKNGDRINLTLPKSLRLEAVPDNPRRAAVLWGPLVLAGDLGPHNEQTLRKVHQQIPVFAAANQSPQEWLQPVTGKANTFASIGVGREKDVELVPFYRLHNRTYAVYWDFFTPAEWQAEAAKIGAERKRQAQLEKATVSFVQPGEMQPERDFNQQGEETEPARVSGRPGRRGKKWFSFDMPVDATHPLKLIATYNTDEWRTRTFDIVIDGQRIASQKVERQLPGKFFDVEYAVPTASIIDKTKVTVRFEATGGNEIAALFGLRLVRVLPLVAPSVTRLDPPEGEFFSKQLDYDGIQIKAHEVVDDKALMEAQRRLHLMLGHLPVVRENLRSAGAELHIIGKDQVTSDLPEHRHLKGKKLEEYNGLTVDERTRGLGGLLTSCGEENLLHLPGDRYKGRDICLHEFAHNVLSHGVSPDVRQKIREQWKRSTEKGLWKGAYAASNEHEFFAELTMWYFGTRGDLSMSGEKPADGPAGLKKYDPEAYQLLDDFYCGRITVAAKKISPEK